MLSLKKDWISNWLLIEEDEKKQQKQAAAAATKLSQKSAKNKRKKSNRNKSKKLKKPARHNDDNNELIRSPISGTYIIKDWSEKALNKSDEEMMNRHHDDLISNKIAASYVDTSEEARAKLAKISNRIGPYECKLCLVVYRDAFQLAMHDCPRVVSIDYQ
jgi:hypothetical protein